jgi:hypothetical protein
MKENVQMLHLSMSMSPGDDVTTVILYLLLCLLATLTVGIAAEPKAWTT